MTTTAINKIYPLQLWLTALGLAPIIMAVVSHGQGEFSFLFVVLIFSLPLSLPVLLIDLFFFKILIKKFSSPTLIKLLLNLISIVGLIITFQIISGSMALEFTLIYSGSIIVASILYKIYIHKEINLN